MQFLSFIKLLFIITKVAIGEIFHYSHCFKNIQLGLMRTKLKSVSRGTKHCGLLTQSSVILSLLHLDANILFLKKQTFFFRPPKETFSLQCMLPNAVQFPNSACSKYLPKYPQYAVGNQLHITSWFIFYEIFFCA